MGFRIRGRVALASLAAAIAFGACCPKEGCIKDPPCAPKKAEAKPAEPKK